MAREIALGQPDCVFEEFELHLFGACEDGQDHEPGRLVNDPVELEQSGERCGGPPIPAQRAVLRPARRLSKRRYLTCWSSPINRVQITVESNQLSCVSFSQVGATTWITQKPIKYQATGSLRDRTRKQATTEKNRALIEAA